MKSKLDIQANDEKLDIVAAILKLNSTIEAAALRIEKAIFSISHSIEDKKI